MQWSSTNCVYIDKTFPGVLHIKYCYFPVVRRLVLWLGRSPHNLHLSHSVVQPKLGNLDLVVKALVQLSHITLNVEWAVKHH